MHKEHVDHVALGCFYKQWEKGAANFRSSELFPGGVCTLPLIMWGTKIP